MTATPAGMTYADYLKLDQLLSAQQPLSDLHDEMLFIVIHQTKELWMKELLHELRLAVELVQADRFAEAYKSMARISRIQAVMTLSWDVLSVHLRRWKWVRVAVRLELSSRSDGW